MAFDVSPTTVAPSASLTASGTGAKKRGTRIRVSPDDPVMGNAILAEFTMPASGKFNRTISAPGGADRSVTLLLQQRRTDGVWAQTASVPLLLATAGGGGGTTPPSPPPDTTAPTIGSPVHTGLTQTTITIACTTNEPATVVIEYGLTTSYGSSTGATSLGTSHSRNLSGLTAGTVYFYRINATDVATNVGTRTGTFTTTSVAPSPPAAPTGLTATPGNTTVTLNWNAISGATYKVYRDTVLIASPTTNSYVDTGRTNGVQYSYKVSAVNGGGEGAQSGAVTATPTSPPTDTTPPVNGTPTLTGLTQTGVTVAWTTNEPATGQVEYGTTTGYGSTTGATALATSHSRAITGLTPGTLYHYRLRATDPSSNLGLSVDRTFTTTVAVPPPTGATMYGTLDARPANVAEYLANGLTIAGLQTGWDRHEKPTAGLWSTSDLNAYAADFAAFKNAGLKVSLEMGINYPPAFYQNSTYKFIDQFGTAASGRVLDWIWRATARDKVEAYVRKLNEYVPLTDTTITDVRISTDEISELLFPQHTQGGTVNSYWAYSTPAQGGAGLATGTVGGVARNATAVPSGWAGWDPGDALPGGKPDVSEWYGWYLDSLVEATTWMTALLRSLGFTGRTWAVIPGQGARPTQQAAAYTALLGSGSNPATMAVGAAFHLVYPRLAASGSGIGGWCSSVAENVLMTDITQGGDAQLSSESESWSSMRRHAWLAVRNGMLRAVENPGGGTSGYGLTMLDYFVRQAKACGATVASWAHETNLDNATGGSNGGPVTFAGYRNMINPPPPPPPTATLYGPAIGADGLANTQVGGTDSGGNNQSAYRFRAGQSSHLSAIRVFLEVGSGYSGGNGGTMEVSVQLDSGGVPSGTNLAQTTIQGSASRFPLIAFSTPANLVAGTVYHVVFRNTDAQWQTNFVSVNGLIYESSPQPAQRQPKYPDTDWAQHMKPASTWTLRPTYTPILELTYANGQREGMGYMESGITTGTKPIGGANKVRELFATSANRTITAVHVRVRRLSGSAALDVRLEKADGTLVVAGSIPAASIPTAAQLHWVSVSLSASIDPGTYHLILSSTGSYQTFGLRQGSGYGFTSASFFNDGRMQYTSGGAWQNVEQWGSASAEMDLQFYLALA